jgi:predicted N-acetyltransferase YhbS
MGPRSLTSPTSTSSGHRGRGLGLELVREAVDDGPLSGTRWLLHTDDVHDLYRKLGFGAPSAMLMERPRRRRPRGE